MNTLAILVFGLAIVFELDFIGAQLKSIAKELRIINERERKSK